MKKFLIYFICLFMMIPFVKVNAEEVKEEKSKVLAKTAKSAILLEESTGEILYEYNSHEIQPPASMTKMMSLLLIMEAIEKDVIKWDQMITVSSNASGMGGSQILLETGEKMSVDDLVKGIAIASGNDAVVALAEAIAGTEENFVKMMNDKASELGLTGTHYSNPVGLHEEETYTTVRDTYTLTKYALQYDLFKTVTSASRYRFTTTKGTSRTLSTTNFLIDKNTNYWYQYASGVKTGYTDKAGRCLVSTASYNNYNYMCILFGCTNSPSRRYDFIETKELYRWAFNNFSYKEVAKSDEPVCEIPVELSSETDFVALYFKEPFVTILPNGADQSTLVVKNNFISESVDAPIKKGDILGQAEIYYAEKLIGKVDLVAGNNVEKSTVLAIIRSIKNFFASDYMKIVYFVLAAIVVIFIIICIILNLPKKKRKVRYIPYSENDKSNKK